MKLLSGFRRNDNYKTNVSTTKPLRRRKTTQMRKFSSTSHQFRGMSQLTIGQPISERFDRNGYNLTEHNVVGLPTTSSRVSNNDHRHSQAAIFHETKELHILETGKHKCRVNIYLTIMFVRFAYFISIFKVSSTDVQLYLLPHLIKNAFRLAIMRCKLVVSTYSLSVY